MFVVERLSGFNLIFLKERKEQLRQELSKCIACLSGKTNLDCVEMPFCAWTWWYPH